MEKRKFFTNGKTESWLNAIPLIAFFFAAALMYWSGVGFSGFVGSLAIPVALFLLVPLLNYIGVDSQATNWFIRAGIISLLAVIINLVPYILNPSVWASLAIDIIYLLTMIAVIIGVVMSLIKIKN
ncbi:hypothetical protein AUJ10_00710 [Candidatus Pacearchaeota archaeon CG1_02_31_27]|nr:MAG: hypothetical protein AUJ10_00710 [Candidatus Pacearchaeota archaeon CG1_02_31_27]PIN92338.1 MAG: hypothetical protein COU55_00820 [Candidatus Pacearchaeota archaeon CG10_big_fil_rev_8_21_14_0_10_31_59]PIZ80006.1 MAG: hypothetical protein COX99_03460 [Candidatus Pacearchaeota archaeon CG_4_10_14_0_2_um_filter_31_10]